MEILAQPLLFCTHLTVVDLGTNTRVSGALLEISYNWNVGLWLRGGSRTPNNRCCEQMKLS